MDKAEPKIAAAVGSRLCAFAAAVAAMFLLTHVGRAGEPAGIYALLPSYNSERPVGLENLSVWDKENVRGVTVRTVWKNVQPVAGSPDWSFFDEAVRLAAEHGKQVGLSLAAGVYSPAWVYAAGVRPFHFTLTGPWQRTEASTMPEPWDPAFQREWAKVVAALGERYDLNPNVAYIMVAGFGFDVESFYVKTPPDIAQLDRLGGPASWLQGAEQIVDLYAAAFPHKPFVLAMAPPVPGPTGIAWLRQLVEYGMRRYPGRFGVMYDGLDAVADASIYQNAAVSTYSDVSPTGFQMVWSSEGTEGQQRLKGTLDEALNRAAALKAHWVEVYEADCENPDYQEKLSETNQELEQSASTP